MSATRRALFAGGVAIAAIATPAVALASPPSNATLAADLDHYNEWTARLNLGTSANPAPESEWDRWDAQGTLVYGAIERAPCTPENIRLKAHAIYSILEGDLSCLNEQGTNLERLLVQIIGALVAQ